MGWWIVGAMDWWRRLKRGHLTLPLSPGGGEGKASASSRVCIGFTEQIFCPDGFKIWNCYGIATEKRTGSSEPSGQLSKRVNIFFKFLFPPTTTTKPKRRENARRDFRAEQVDEKTGRISAACAQARAVFAASDAIERSDYEHD
jgi:hypothetical protein